MNDDLESECTYIDNINMVQTATNTNNAIFCLKTRSEIQIDRAKILHIRYSPDKSDLMFCFPTGSAFKSIEPDDYPAFVIHNQRILPKFSRKYLSVCLDESLTFKQHALAAAAIGLKHLGSLKFLRMKTQGLPAFVAHYLVISKALPAMPWASPVWWNRTPTVLRPLQITYNSLARWITGLPPSTRVAKHLTCAGIPPLDIYLYYLLNKYAIRLLFLPPDHALDFPPPDLNNPKPPYPTSAKLFKQISHLAIEPVENRSLPITEQISKIVVPGIEKDEKAIGIHLSWLKSLNNITILCYTDGSKQENGLVGSGFVYYRLQNSQLCHLSTHSCRLGNRNEAYDSELHSCLETLRNITIYHPNLILGHLILCIDNSSAIDALDDPSTERINMPDKQTKRLQRYP
jgi:hypothetical protein